MRPRGALLLTRWIAGGIVAFVARAALAAGDPRPLGQALHVEPGATCITAPALAEHARAWLGSDQVDADLWVEVRGSEDDPRVASFTMGRGAQVLARRRFEPGPDRCEDLHAALGLAIALAIRVSLLDDFKAPVPPAAPARREPWTVAGDVVGSWGLLPGSAFGAGVWAGRALPPNFEVRLGVEGQGARNKTFAQVAGEFDAALLAATLAACVTFGVDGPVHGRACTGFDAGGIFAQGKGFATPESSVARWLAAASSIGVTIDVAPSLSVEGTLTLVLPLEHPQIRVQTSSGAVLDARDLSSAGGELAFGPVYRF
jgi:hypothetical protein